MTSRVLTLQDVAIVSSDPDKAPYSPYGYIINGDGRLYGLTERWFHGVVLAVLYPELAAKHGYEPPTREDDFVDVFRYQHFEHDHCGDLPVIRVAHSLLTGGTVVSTGQCAASEAQLKSLLAALNSLGLRGTDTLTGEEDDPTVSEFIDSLRQHRLAEEAAAQDNLNKDNT